jgi:hypothetical protein
MWQKNKTAHEGRFPDLAEREGLFVLRVASAQASSLTAFGTACGVLRERCSLVEP